MKKKPLVVFLITIVGLLFAWLTPTFIFANIETLTEPKVLVDVQEFFVNQYKFITDNLAFLLVLFGLFTGGIFTAIAHLPNKKNKKRK